MKSTSFPDQAKHEIQAVQGEATKDKTYTSEQTFPDEASAIAAFDRSVAKLLTINGWSGLSLFTADFFLHDATGQPNTSGPPQVGDYIQIRLPGPMPENWVRVTHVAREENRVEFTVHPSRDPREEQSEAIQHFFQAQASSTFRVERIGTTIRASEIGHDEAINNKGSQAGDRAMINTAIAEMGWLFYQKLQWKLLTDYLVHL
ncbi:nuclear transport factor 2 family protein [Fibrella forsythiae]|uniref:Nuclear transport factor 2 family protein n=1 Tax=Fibrella forsythiae TaxID=2817061 RepID=A0ABS3JFA1_9BACT|nr:nuclear transport factor 2 family protein [Fibrella forsythiae]MBO0948672.1 nuclear transport factor 2 family protein [Fibrella forsythiae]